MRLLKNKFYVLVLNKVEPIDFCAQNYILTKTCNKVSRVRD